MLRITGNKVVLKEATTMELDELYFWKFEEKKQEAKKWNGPYIPEEKLTKEAYRTGWDNEILPGIPSSLVIQCDGKTIGYVGSYWIDRNTNWLETGIVIYDSNFWNGGFGTEAYKLWIEYLFTSTDIHRLGMSTWSGNVRMIKVADKLGMKEEARIREARMVNGEYFDAIKMGILKKEWEAINCN
ncbi:GNAT family N-acetyltransferase [Aquibacillus sediminis]|uniref:GNAT family N-acetyltransferase n=1 Tax=Aquibacillus sediminis TaxID=2574734 RepID=UPI0011095373|nr:GNAT family protein [Aquibacillus sediminis]